MATFAAEVTTTRGSRPLSVSSSIRRFLIAMRRIAPLANPTYRTANQICARPLTPILSRSGGRGSRSRPLPRGEVGALAPGEGEPPHQPAATCSKETLGRPPSWAGCSNVGASMLLAASRSIKVIASRSRVSAVPAATPLPGGVIVVTHRGTLDQCMSSKEVAIVETSALSLR